MDRSWTPECGEFGGSEHAAEHHARVASVPKSIWDLSLARHLDAFVGCNSVISVPDNF